MSFKREGNDTNLLGTLQKRRIKELLCEDIPEDEAKLLCNGRFACIVCPSNPIFDTVSMLSVHRKGKKHLSNLEVHEKKNTELKQLIARRRHEQFLKDGTTSIKMAAREHKGLLMTSPYDPCVKKGNKRKGERRPILDLDAEAESLHNHSAPSASNGKDLPGSSSHWRETYELQLSGPIKHDHQLKNIFKSKVETSVRLSPYQRQNGRGQQSFKQKDEGSSKTSSLTFQTDRLRCEQKHLSIPSDSRQHWQPAPMNSSVRTVPLCASAPLLPQISDTDSYTQPLMFIPADAGSQNHHFGPNISLQSTTLASQPPPPPPPSNKGEEQPTHSTNPSSKSKESKVNMEAKKSAEQNLVAQKLKQLQGSGWKRDWDGKWIKDENAEFDSDEEPPDIP